MIPKSFAPAPIPPKLTDEEAITLRRIAFGQSEVRALRRDDIDRLRRLALIVASKHGFSLTASGQELVESLPRSLFATKTRPGNGL